MSSTLLGSDWQPESYRPQTVIYQPVAKATPHVTWSYNVTWEEDYLNSAYAGNSKIHWFFTVDSLFIMLFLSGMVAMIMWRALHTDFSRYVHVHFYSTTMAISNVPVAFF